MKSGYFLMKESMEGNEITNPSSSFKDDNKLWKKVRKLRFLNKIKNFIWRLCPNSLATNINLYQR